MKNPYDKKIKQLEKYLIVKKVAEQSSSHKRFPHKLIIRNETMHIRQRELQNKVNDNFHRLIHDYDISPPEDPGIKTQKFLEQFLELDLRDEMIDKQFKARKIKAKSEITQMSTNDCRLPTIMKTLPKEQGCDLILEQCDIMKSELKSLKKQNKRGMRKNAQSLRKMHTKLTTIQTTNFLNNDLILL